MVKTSDGTSGGDAMVKSTEVKPTESMEKLSAKASTIKSREYPNFPQSETGGAIPMTIQSRFSLERQRLGGDLTDKWRQWRAQWIKDQTLHPAEPLHVKELERELYNPIRKAMRAPWNWVELKLATVMSPHKAYNTRRGITTLIGCYGFTLWIYYLLKYHQRTWEDSGRTGWPQIVASRELVLPGDPAYPNVGIKFKKEEFGDLGFASRKALLFKDPNSA